jgi:hypothetical protein
MPNRVYPNRLDIVYMTMQIGETEMRIAAHLDGLVAEPWRTRTLENELAIILVVCFLTLNSAFAQGTLQDYQRAQGFLPGN